MSRPEQNSPEQKCTYHEKKYADRRASIGIQPIHQLPRNERKEYYTRRGVDKHSIEKMCKRERDYTEGDCTDNPNDDRPEEAALAHSERLRRTSSCSDGTNRSATFQRDHTAASNEETRGIADSTPPPVF